MIDEPPRIRQTTKPAQVCFCNEFWICERHPKLGWPHVGCDAPGMPCRRRWSGDDRPPLPEDWESYASVDDDD
jgi:hypothetical protein